eukprot:3487881-Rhodomonas_salina.1
MRAIRDADIRMPQTEFDDFVQEVTSSSPRSRRLVCCCVVAVCVVLCCVALRCAKRAADCADADPWTGPPQSARA